MISQKHKTIFVHIPKAGGQSIETMFLDNEGLKWDDRSELLLREKTANEKGPERLAHLKASEYVDYNYLSKSDFNEFYKFSFVRNPYKRVFSFYQFLGYSKIMSLKTFIENVLPLKVRDSHFFFISQYEYLYDENENLLVDFVGKLETIKEDIKKVINHSGIENAFLPHVNKSKGEWSRVASLLVKNPKYLGSLAILKQFDNTFEKQFTNILKEQVYELYQKDFQYFNYKK